MQARPLTVQPFCDLVLDGALAWRVFELFAVGTFFLRSFVRGEIRVGGLFEAFAELDTAYVSAVLRGDRLADLRI